MLNGTVVPEEPIKFECVSALSKPELWYPFTNVHYTLFNTPNLSAHKSLKINKKN